MQQLPAGGGAVVPAPTVPGAGGPDAIDGELVPTLNGYMRSRVFREVSLKRAKGRNDQGARGV